MEIKKAQKNETLRKGAAVSERERGLIGGKDPRRTRVDGKKVHILVRAKQKTGVA